MQLNPSRRAIRSALLTGWVLAGVGTVQPVLAQSAGSGPVTGSERADNALTLEAAIRQTLEASALPAVAAARRDALIAAREAAGLKPQPSVEVTAENFGLPTGNLYDQFQITGT